MNLPCFECPFGDLGFQVDLAMPGGVALLLSNTSPDTWELQGRAETGQRAAAGGLASYDWDGGITERRLVSCDVCFNMLCVHRSLMIFFQKWCRMISWIPGCCAGFIVERWWEMLQLPKFDLPYVAICRGELFWALSFLESKVAPNCPHVTFTLLFLYQSQIPNVKQPLKCTITCRRGCSCCILLLLISHAFIGR